MPRLSRTKTRERLGRGFETRERGPGLCFPSPFISSFLLLPPGDPGNWYSSDEDEGGSSVTSILKSLRQQSSGNAARPHKGQAGSSARPADPRLRDPRLSRNADPSGEPGPSDPRLARHIPSAIPKPEPHSSASSGQKPPLLPDEEEGERALRDKPISIPLDALPGHSLRDPRSQLQQFSHIKKDVVLHKPNFARMILWSPEDLIPLPIPKQEFIPVPAALQSMPALDPRLNRSQASLSDPRQRAGSAPGDASASGSASSGLPDFELLSRILKTVSAGGSPQSDKPSDPRVRKAPADPRLHKTMDPAASRASKPTDPAPGAGEAAPAIAPYDPRLLTGTGQSSVLSAISLYDPRTPNSGGKASEPLPEGSSKASECGKPPAKAKEPLFVRRSALEHPDAEKGCGESATDRYNSYNRPRPKAAGNAADPGAPHPGVHNLPVPPVYGMVKQSSKSGAGSPFAGNSPAQDSEQQDAASLKDVFKGFDPTASPFCQ